MKKRVAGLASVLAFGLVAAAFAASKTSGSMSLSDPALLNGKELTAGTYKVAWTGTGADVAVTLKKDGKVVAEARGTLVEMKRPASDDAVVTRKNAAGASSLAEVRFGGRTTELVFSAS